jgi:hypothetical protein
MFSQRRWRALSFALIVMVASIGSARAQDDSLWDFSAPGHWRAVIGPYTRHLHQEPEYEYVWAMALERQRDDL